MLPSSVGAQAVPALAVGVVDDDVERGHAPEIVRVIREQGEVMLLRVVMHEALHHPEADGTVAQHGVGNDRPTQRFRYLARRDFAVAQRAPREVP